MIATRIVLISCLLVGARFSLASQLEYTIRELGLPPSSQDAGSINDFGQVAFSTTYGWTNSPPFEELANLYYFDGSVVHQLPSLGGPFSAFQDINNQGVIVGLANSTETYTTRLGVTTHVVRAVRYENNQLEDIGVPNTVWSEASSINDLGQIVGNYFTQTGTEMFLLDPQVGLITLPNLGGDAEYPIGINNFGEILIQSSDRQIEQYGDYRYGSVDTLVYKNGTVTRLPGLGTDLVYGSDINQRGQVAGSYMAVPGKESHAFIWDPGSGTIDIGKLGESSGASDINDYGVVVGNVLLDEPWKTEAFIYDQQNGRRKLIDLLPPNSGWSKLDSATDINNRGQIIGIGGHDGYGRRVFLMTPVPEPHSAILLGAVISLLVIGRRKRRCR